jgi:hydroxyacylglutathione hydrolase
MKPVEIMEDLFFIERGYLNGNHFVYRCDAPILIDTGYVGDFEITGRLIKGLGVGLLDTSMIINTHCHCDHIGGNRIIQDLSGCDIALHRLGKHFMDTRDDWSTWWRYYGQEADFFRCTKALEDGDSLDIGPHSFQILHTPGHASDGIVLYEAREKVLISSDTLWEYDVATITTRVEGSTAVHDLKASLERLARLKVDRVYPGHGAPFRDFKGALEKSLKKVEAYLTERETVGEDLLKKILVYTLLMKRFVPDSEFFPMLMETPWFKETVDFYFNSGYKAKYNEIMSDLLRRGVVERKNGNLYTTVQP